MAIVRNRMAIAQSYRNHTGVIRGTSRLAPIRPPQRIVNQTRLLGAIASFGTIS